MVGDLLLKCLNGLCRLFTILEVISMIVSFDVTHIPFIALGGRSAVVIINGFV